QERNIESASELLSPDLFMIDPTAIVFGGPLATGIKGRDKIVALINSWNINEMNFDQEVVFWCGEFACAAGTLSYTIDGALPIKDVPFANILRVKDGKIIERTDYGDYTQSFTEPPASPEPDLESIATKYLLAYLEMRYKDLALLLDEKAVFIDPTSAILGQGAPREGRSNILNTFQNAFGVVLEFDFVQKRTFFFQNHAVFAGTTRYAMAGAALGLQKERVEFEGIPMLIVLEIVGGKVVKHTEYADYEEFLKQVEGLKDTDD
ncbi:MAG: nuclear transport factor 2 family protein, partial [Planctomycetota bacterium]|nr:nuclear transport factor 2 family protein [Planctomycetota bacterium]